tara:strand:+ start:158 stop:754 length:597 start_codon:yes stop_codon:yes gene_type:complete
MTRIVAVTGGIGSGKSTFSNQVKKRGFKLLDSDEQVGSIYKKPKKNFLNFLKKINLGSAIKNKKIHKKKISNKIFYDKETKLRLERFIFKIIRKKRSHFIDKEKKKKTKIIFLDIPLLFENNLEKEFDIIISILSTKKERYKRLRKTKKITKELFNKIVKSQTSDIERKNKSDIIIINNKSMREYIKKIEEVIEKVSA